MTKNDSHETEFSSQERDLLRKFETPEPPSDIRRKVLAELLGEPAESWWSRFLSRLRGPRLALVGACAAVAVLAVVLLSRGGEIDSPGVAATSEFDASPVVAESVERAEDPSSKPICAGAYDLNKCIRQAHHRGLAVHQPRSAIPRYEQMMAMHYSPNEGEGR